MPRLAEGHTEAAQSLGRSIRVETLAFLAIFAITAIFTGVTVPPIHLP